MTLQDLRFALELGCIMQEDIDAIVAHCKEHGIDTDEVDNQLVAIGYEKIFEQLDDSYEDDDDYDYIEKFPHKNKFYED